MARIRTIKPDFFRHHELYMLETESHLPVRLAFAGLWTAADKDGRFKWRPPQLKLDCLPFDVLEFADVLVALERGGFICRYEVDGIAYGCIRNWSKHQRPRNDEEASRIPAPPSSLGVDTSPSLFSDESVSEQSRGKEGKGKEVEGSTAAARARAGDALVFPTDGKPSEWLLSVPQLEEWVRAYPGLDVVAEVTHALAWVRADAGHHKTANGMPRFLVNWLNRSTNRGHGRPNGNGREPVVTTDERRRAEQLRRTHRGCMHQPRCATSAACIGLIVREWRQQEAEGLQGGHE